MDLLLRHPLQLRARRLSHHRLQPSQKIQRIGSNRPLQFLSIFQSKKCVHDTSLVQNRISDPSARYPLALKVVEKSCLHSNLDSDRRARWEISVLNHLKHKHSPFLSFLIGFLETREFLAWAILFFPGRDLNVLRFRQSDNVFSSSVTRFYLAEICVSFVSGGGFTPEERWAKENQERTCGGLVVSSINNYDIVGASVGGGEGGCDGGSSEIKELSGEERGDRAARFCSEGGDRHHPLTDFYPLLGEQA
ncbi:hypothetical protein L2E82_19894 [Cichorium intybus]|uniref:Uncharacterized protein n=1 Tax=Cichorium intybus TaxID=13427 RepID=A0ACB9DRU2_CICIN|nr:hypothetical protein L2E82_19894 [Cichorium intybus]